ncbi:Lrp/AsnC family transcriptional regulator [archaeon]|nr:Lrp/AsnC family transcriptional regulator [archaeon]
MQLSDFEKKLLIHYSREGVDLTNSNNASKNLRVSPQTISYKMKALENENVILGYRYRVDYRRLGLNQIAWVFISLKDKSVDSEALLKKLIAIPQIQICTIVTGTFDFAAKVFSEDVKTMTNFGLELQKKFKDEIKSLEMYFLGRVIKWHQKLISEDFENYPYDKTDLKILSCKLTDPMKNLGECAKDVGLHRNTVSSRWKKMIDGELIIKKSVILNPDYSYQLNQGVNAFLFFESESGETENLASKLSGFNEVHELNIVNHPFDLMASIRVKDVASLHNFQTSLWKNSEINKLILSTQTIVVLHSMRKPFEQSGDLIKLMK